MYHDVKYNIDMSERNGYVQAVANAIFAAIRANQDPNPAAFIDASNELKRTTRCACEGIHAIDRAQNRRDMAPNNAALKNVDDYILAEFEAEVAAAVKIMMDAYVANLYKHL